jgi:hypothetical protein
MSNRWNLAVHISLWDVKDITTEYKILAETLKEEGCLVEIGRLSILEIILNRRNFKDCIGFKYRRRGHNVRLFSLDLVYFVILELFSRRRTLILHISTNNLIRSTKTLIELRCDPSVNNTFRFTWRITTLFGFDHRLLLLQDHNESESGMIPI